MTETIQSLINKGKPFLREYLESQGVEIVKHGSTEFFRCINPDHEDRNPSNGFVKGTDDTQFHCFSCLSANGDVYTAAHLLEGKPLYGLGFVTDNVEYILNKFSVDYEPVELSEEQLTKLKFEAIYNTAAQMLVEIDPTTGAPKYTTTQHAEERGWKPTTCTKLRIGTVLDYNSFIEDLSKKVRLDKEDVVSAGIRDNLFGPDLLTFSVSDHIGQVRGFAARYLQWVKGSPQPKYRNTAIRDCPFYHKDELLYCLNFAKKYSSLRLDVFEGYGSAVTAHQNMYFNCCAIGGTSLTDLHVSLIRDLGFSHINLVLDQDSTGSELMERYIEKFSGYAGLTITVAHLPLSEEDKKKQGQNDPDFWIQKYGITKYRSLKCEGVFSHMLKKHREALDPTGNPEFTKKFAKRMIPLIINEADMIERGQMIKILAEQTGIEKEDIKDEIDRIEQTDVRTLRDDLSRKLRVVDDPDTLQELLSKTINSIGDTTTTKKDRYLVSLGETVEVFDQIFTEMNELTPGVHGWATGLVAFDNMFDGIPKPTKGGVAFGLAGPPQHGKSGLLLNLSLMLAKNNDDISICYWAIDDHRKAIAYRLVSMLSGVPMKQVRNTVKRTELEEQRIVEAQDQLRHLISERKLVFKDDRYGRSKKKAENWIKETQDATSNHVLFCIDSLHNIQGEADIRVKLLNSSTWVASLCAAVPCTVLATMEMVKNRERGKKPTLTQISESVKMEFDFDTVGIVWNEAQGNYCSVDQVKAKWGSPGMWKPIIELDIQKNKAGAGEKGSLYFKYDTDTTAIVDCSSFFDMMEEQKEIEIASKDGGTYRYEHSSASKKTGW